MIANLDKIALELYGKIQTRFPDIKIGDENAAVLSRKEDIPKARFFEFEYEENGESLGTIAITLDANDGVVVQVSGDLVNDDDDTGRHSAYKFVRSFRQFAKHRLLNFDIQNIGKSNLDKRDYTFQAKRKEEPVMPQTPIMENKLYGTMKLSYQDLGEARLVIKHSQPVDINNPAGRTMHIEGIYIENAQGERFKYPYKHINGARALAEHIKHGGTPYDELGKHISGLSEELAHLRKFKGYVNRQEQLSEAMSSVTGRVMERIEEIKKTIQHLQRPAFYESFVESFQGNDNQQIPESVINDLIDRLTIRTFNEELKSVFPYIYKFIDESELPVIELTADDMLGEKAPEGWEGTVKAMKKHKDEIDNPWALAHYMKGKGYKSHKKESLDIESAYEDFMESIVTEDKDEIFSPNKDAQQAAIHKLNDLMSGELKGGPEGINAIESLKGLIDDPEFIDSLKDTDPDLDVRPLVQQFIQLKAPNIASQLEFGDDETGGQDIAPAPMEPMAEPAPMEPMAEPAPMEPAAAPVAEGKGDDVPFDGPYKKVGDDKDQFGNTIKQNNLAKHLAKKGMAKAIEKAKKAGATLETLLDFGSQTMTLAEMIEGCGMAPQDFGFEQPEEQGLPAMLKYISGFYNKDDGNFPLGGMRVKIKVKKAFEDGEFGESDPADLLKVIKFIDMKDPSGDEQRNVLKLAGVRDSSQTETNMMPNFETMATSLDTEIRELSNPMYEAADNQLLQKMLTIAGLR
jgi:hypothetical protein